MRRGFKSQAETRSAQARYALGLDKLAPLDPWAYAQYLGVVVLNFSELGLKQAVIRQLTVTDDESWSAMTLKEGDTVAIVINPAHRDTRQRNDLMHELAHVELMHTPARVEVARSGLLLLSDYSDDQEQEADWLAGAYLVPREGLVHMRSRRKEIPEIASYYCVSPALCEWRLRMTGVDIQMRRRAS